MQLLNNSYAVARYQQNYQLSIPNLSLFFVLKLALFGPRFEDSEKLTRRGISASLRVCLALFGFVFLEPEDDFIFIILCFNGANVHLSIQQIGFVLHNLVVHSSLFVVHCL